MPADALGLLWSGYLGSPGLLPDISPGPAWEGGSLLLLPHSASFSLRAGVLCPVPLPVPGVPSASCMTVPTQVTLSVLYSPMVLYFCLACGLYYTLILYLEVFLYMSPFIYSLFLSSYEVKDC